MNQQQRVQAFHDKAQDEYFISKLKSCLSYFVNKYKIQQANLYREVMRCKTKSEANRVYNLNKDELKSNHDDIQKKINKLVRLLDHHHGVIEKQDHELRTIINTFRAVNMYLKRLILSLKN